MITGEWLTVSGNLAFRLHDGFRLRFNEAVFGGGKRQASETMLSFQNKQKTLLPNRRTHTKNTHKYLY